MTPEIEYEECPHCHGTCQEMPDCETCEGNGWEEDPSDGGTMECTECGDEKCSTCGGTGEVVKPNGSDQATASAKLP